MTSMPVDDLIRSLIASAGVSEPQARAAVAVLLRFLDERLSVPAPAQFERLAQGDSDAMRELEEIARLIRERIRDRSRERH